MRTEPQSPVMMHIGSVGVVGFQNRTPSLDESLAFQVRLLEVGATPQWKAQ